MTRLIAKSDWSIEREPASAVLSDIHGLSQPLNGNMSGLSLALAVLAFSAPIAVVEGFIPLAIQFGGPGASFAFLISMGALLLFAIGYTTMASHIPKSGAFYTFISAGMGKGCGLGAAFLAVTSYFLTSAGSYVFLGNSVTALVEGLIGLHTSWFLWSLIGWICVSILGYCNIEFSAKILSYAMAIEIAVVMAFNLAVLHHFGPAHLSLGSVSPHALLQGNVSVTLLFTTLVFFGFEATVLFRNEVRNPSVAIPRATYGAVLFIGVLYFLSCYCLVTAYGATAWSVAREHPSTMFAQAIGTFIHPALTQITYCSVIISLLAALISIHNVLSRYIRTLAVDSALPTLLGNVHPHHKSPHTASVTISVLVGLALTICAAVHADSEKLYGAATGLGGLGVIILLGFVSLSVIAYFSKNGRPVQMGVWRLFIVPSLATFIFFGMSIIAVLHIGILIGDFGKLRVLLVSGLTMSFLFGVLLSVYFKIFRKDVYQRLGGGI